MVDAAQTSIKCKIKTAYRQRIFQSTAEAIFRGDAIFFFDLNVDE